MNKFLVVSFVIVFFATGLYAGQQVTYLKDGNAVSQKIFDMSSRTGEVEYANHTKIHKSRIWMINFANKQWNFPNERANLSTGSDTIFLHSGGVIHGTIIDFSSRRRVFELKQGRPIPEGNIKRIYFCCVKLPGAFKSKLRAANKKKHVQKPVEKKKTVKPASKLPANTFLLAGKVINTPIKYLNKTKTGFTDSLQINTKDIWMINFVDTKSDFAGERGKLNPKLDTVFLKNGKVAFDTIVDYDNKRGTFRFSNLNPIAANQIKRIYFCCTQYPAAYKGKRRGIHPLKRTNKKPFKRKL
ncbi:MAG: hypothetical protein GY757_40585 [bacterium]|nr:hypothetical protein [bacterium]